MAVYLLSQEVTLLYKNDNPDTTYIVINRGKLVSSSILAKQ